MPLSVAGFVNCPAPAGLEQILTDGCDPRNRIGQVHTPLMSRRWFDLFAKRSGA